MTIRFFTLLTSFLLVLSCSKKSGKEGTTISGTLHSSESRTVYLNLIDHFDFLNDEYNIDSTSVSEDGTFVFEGQNLESKLISLTTKKFAPYTYQAFRAMPQAYYYGNCEKFFTSEPTFYISDENSISIHWYQTQSIDSISSPDNSGIHQVALRAFYLASKKIETSNLDYDKKDSVDVNLKKMIEEREFDLKSIDHKNISNADSFDNYIYSEIYLGHLNTFLNWFEEYHSEKVDFAINNQSLKNTYLEIFSEYNSHNWNSKSLEYYKFTERYVNHHISLQNKSFEHYYKPSQEKRELAKKVLNEANEKKYLNSIDKQLNNIL
jgi:hypothetical protein